MPVSALPPVELHVISDSTGETAARLVSALEAQFPDLDFEEDLGLEEVERVARLLREIETKGNGDE